jgi:hypothetical protein
LKDTLGSSVPCVRAHFTTTWSTHLSALPLRPHRYQIIVLQASNPDRTWRQNCSKVPIEPLEVPHTGAGCQLGGTAHAQWAIQPMGASESRIILERTVTYLHALVIPQLPRDYVPPKTRAPRTGCSSCSLVSGGMSLWEGMCDGQLCFVQQQWGRICQVGRNKAPQLSAGC